MAPWVRPLRTFRAAWISAVCSVAWAGSAQAQQPLPVFLEAADSRAVDLREARALQRQARSQIKETRARLLPSLRANGGYTRNQFEISVEFPNDDGTIERAVISPNDQWDATITVAVPLVDVGAWADVSASKASARATEARTKSVRLETRVLVCSAYAQLVATRALKAAAKRTLETTEENLRIVRARVEHGAASSLDAARAETDVERAKQSIADAELQEALATRSLWTLTGVEPTGQDVKLEDSLAEEPPLATWMRHAPDTPQAKEAEAALSSAEKNVYAARRRLLPVLSAEASERFTNAAGFARSAQWALGARVDWTVDFMTGAAIKTSKQTRSVSAIAYERSVEQAETAIYEAWHRVASLRAALVAARAAERAGTTQVETARARYAAGAGTQFDVSQSERDYFEAQVARIQAEADLYVARLVLRIRSAQSI